MLLRSGKQDDPKGMGMKRLSVFLAAVSVASAFTVVSAAPASAKCVGEPVNPCVLICEVGQSNKYTEGAFRFCHVW